MSFSDRPTNPPRLTRLRDLLQLVATAATLLSATVGVAWAWLDRLASDAEVAAALRAHDANKLAHTVLRERIEQLERELRENHRVSDQLRALWRWQVGYVAADREPDPRLKAAAASYFREQYDEFVSQGHAPDVAFREALKERWYDRPTRGD